MVPIEHLPCVASLGCRHLAKFLDDQSPSAARCTGTYQVMVDSQGFLSHLVPSGDTLVDRRWLTMGSLQS